MLARVDGLICTNFVSQLKNMQRYILFQNLTSILLVVMISMQNHTTAYLSSVAPISHDVLRKNFLFFIDSYC